MLTLYIIRSNVQYAETLTSNSFHGTQYLPLLQFSAIGYGLIQGAVLRRRI